MQKSYKIFLLITTILACLSVVFGAFGAHLVQSMLEPKMYEIYQTAVSYQYYHTFSLFIFLIFSKLFTYNKLIITIICAMMIGILLFSGSLFVYSLTNIKLFALITPFGGVSFIISWILFFVYIVKEK